MIKGSYPSSVERSQLFREKTNELLINWLFGLFNDFLTPYLKRETTLKIEKDDFWDLQMFNTF